MSGRSDAAATLNELEAFLRQPDAVLEPAIVERLKQYVMCQGQPQQAVEYLTDGYQGYAQMAVLMCQWLASTAMPGEERSPEQPPAPPMDEACLLRMLIEERFDPEKFNSIFARGGSGAPSWLNGLLMDADGRKLVYSLSARFSNSLLLNFAIQKVLQQPGREAEVAAVGPSLGSYFGVFHRLVVSRLAAAAATGSEEELKKISQEIKQNAARGQHTYLYVQALLHHLAEQPAGAAGGEVAGSCGSGGPAAESSGSPDPLPSRPGARFRRLAAELEESTAEEHGPSVRRLARLFFPGPRDPTDEPVLELLSEVTAAAAQPSLEAVAKLHAAVAAAPERYLAWLRRPRVFEVLLTALFGPGPPLGASATAALTGLLALAAAGPGEAAEATRAALEQAARLCRAALQEGRPLEGAPPAERVLARPVCAAGVLAGLALRLTRSAFWSGALHAADPLPLLGLLRAIIAAHPRLHGRVRSLLGRTLRALGNASHDVARGLLDCAAALVQAGHVLETLAWAEGWAAEGADPSLLRHLVFAVLEVAAPPYSSAFAGALLRLMMRAGVKPLGGPGGGKAPPAAAARQTLLEEFAAASGALKFRPPLLAREAKFLQALCESSSKGVAM